MSKFFYKSKLSKEEQEELLMDLCDSISSVKDSKEAAQFLKDLLSPQEAEMLAKRVKIAELLLSGWGYTAICDCLKVGDGTIARVSEWLKLTGDGYRLIIKRLKERRKERKANVTNGPESDLEKFKQNRPMLFWPELLVKRLIKSCDIPAQDKNKISEAFKEIKLKPDLYKGIQKETRKRAKNF